MDGYYMNMRVHNVCVFGCLTMKKGSFSYYFRLLRRLEPRGWGEIHRPVERGPWACRSPPSTFFDSDSMVLSASLCGSLKESHSQRLAF